MDLLLPRHHLHCGRTYRHTQRQKHATTKSYAILTTQPNETCHVHTHPSKDAYSRAFLMCPPSDAMTMQVTSHHPVVTAWPPSLSATFPHAPPPHTPTSHTLSPAIRLLRRVQLDWNNQPILGPLSHPITLSPHNTCTSHIATNPRESATIPRGCTQSHPHNPAFTLEEDGWTPTFPGIKCGAGDVATTLPPAPAPCRTLHTLWPGLTLPAPFQSVVCKGLGSGPVPAYRGRQAASWNSALGWGRRLGSPRTKGPGRGVGVLWGSWSPFVPLLP